MNALVIGGCPGAGTALLADLVNASPRAGVIDYPLDALVRDAEPLLAYGRSHSALLATQYGPADLRNQPVYEAYGNIAELIRFPSAERFAQIVGAIVEASLGKRGLTLIGSHAPGDAVAGRAVLARYFPRISYLFALRNPLQAIAAAPGDDVEAAIAGYRRNVRLLLSHAARYPDDCLAVAHEDVLADLPGTARRIGDFLGVPFDDGESLARIVNAHASGDASAGALGDDELDRVRREFPSAIAAWSDRNLSGTGAEVAGALADCVDRMRADTAYRYDAGTADAPFLGLGWSAPQPGGVWSDANRADLFFTVDRDGEYAVCVEAGIRVPEARAFLGVAIDVDGTEAFRTTFVAGAAHLIGGGAAGPQRVSPSEGRKTLLCGPLGLTAGRAHRLTFRLDDPPDAGVLLHGITLTTAVTASS